MAYEQQGFKHGSEVASADLSGNQYYCVALGASGYALAGLGAAVDGILQDKPGSGESCSVQVDGISKAVAGAAIAKGDAVACDAAGKLKVAATGEYILGRALQAAGADGEVIAVLMSRPGRSA